MRNDDIAAVEPQRRRRRHRRRAHHLGRGDRGLPGAHRGLAAAHQRLPAPPQGQGAGAGARHGRGAGRRPAARPAARRADGAQGHVLPQGRALDRRQRDPQRLGRAGHRDGAEEARRGGRGRAGLPQHGRVRGRPDRPQRASRPLPQSVGRDARHRRQLERLGRLGRRRAWSMARWVPTPAARSACRPPPAAWSA